MTDALDWPSSKIRIVCAAFEHVNQAGYAAKGPGEISMRPNCQNLGLRDGVETPRGRKEELASRPGFLMHGSSRGSPVGRSKAAPILTTPPLRSGKSVVGVLPKLAEDTHTPQRCARDARLSKGHGSGVPCAIWGRGVSGPRRI